MKLSFIIVPVLAFSLLSVLFLPIVEVRYTVTYTTWYPDGSARVESESWSERIPLYQFIMEGGNPLRIIAGPGKELEDLEDALRRVRFKETFRGWRSKLTCGEKSAIIMRYLRDKGFKADMGRGMLALDDEEIPHAWVLVHVEGETYVVETSSEGGTPYVVGTVKEAAQDRMRYLEKERWSMEKVEERYKEALDKGLDHYLDIEK